LQVGLLKYEAVLLNLQLRPIQRHPEHSREMTRSVASLACNRLTLDWRVRAAGGFCRPHCLYDVTTIPRLSALSVLSRYC